MCVCSYTKILFFFTLNERGYSDGGDSECYITNTTNIEATVPIPVSGGVTLEDVIKELDTLKQLIHEMKEVSTIT